MQKRKKGRCITMLSINLKFRMPCFTNLALWLFVLCVALPVNAETKLELDETEITGARELPKVLYIVPWKKTGPDYQTLPMGSLIEEVLSPIDVDVFKRQVRYHEMINSPAAETEK